MHSLDSFLKIIQDLRKFLSRASQTVDVDSGEDGLDNLRPQARFHFNAFFSGEGGGAEGRGKTWRG
jgi:hypothetical protein